MDENKKLEFRGSSFMALVPFAIFIVITIALSFFNEYEGHEGLNLLMLDDVIPAGAKLY